ncbi:subtilisin-like serine protease [Porphyromonas gingivalis AJW4]|uniref:S8 family serine peptidase n=1 Tax=Porphyromonas gingivalis TaxID=837 RepID=UPI0006BCADB2|nr:S8 family serine peptidase [Porphyromonas gingivalis]ALA93723.1 subtilisin-like serine protease [Porphyromonas gingivalis AJW4]MCE8190905.1 S8 family peptidase [Porphyromonas gingivalis]
MKELGKTARIILALFFFTMLAYGQEPKGEKGNVPAEVSASYVENEFIIWLNQEVDAAVFAADCNEPVVPKRLLSKRLNIWLFEIKDNVEQRSMIMDNLSRNGDIRHIQNNHTNVTLRDITPNDTHYNKQWAPAKISLPKAWDEYSTGGNTVMNDTIVVAVIDGGAFLNHEDLSFFKNTHEIPNNGIDDDGNGYKDDYDGWNAFLHNGNINSDPHGTHVSGIVGAVGNNAKGVCGVNWNVKVMPIRGSSGYEAIVVEAYSYAMEMRALYNETNGAKGAFVVATNSSFGIDYGNPNNYPIWCSMYDEMGKVGILSCGAGPNLNVNVDNVGDVPSTCPSNYLIGVTNTTQADIKNPSAGYGINNIDIGAPGTAIYSTTPNNTYQYMTGTSMATPQVAGVIALMYASMPKEMIQSCKEDPAKFALMVKQSLLDGADNLSSLNGLVASGRRLNAYGAIKTVLENNPKPVLGGTVQVEGNAVFGQTLTANTTGLTSTPVISDLGQLSYQWRRGTANIEGAVSATYSLVEADINKTINVQVTAANCTGTITSPDTQAIAKADQTAPAAPVMESNTVSSITLVALAGCEYNINEGAWQTSPKFEGLTPNTSYTFRQRKAETSTHFASPASPEAVFSTAEDTGIAEVLAQSIALYPNPTNGELKIKSGDLSVNRAELLDVHGKTLELFDFSGKDAGANASKPNGPALERVINLSHLPAGVYFLRVKTNVGEVVKKVVKE